MIGKMIFSIITSFFKFIGVVLIICIGIVLCIGISYSPYAKPYFSAPSSLESVSK